jgi:hypothetical protein
LIFFIGHIWNSGYFRKRIFQGAPEILIPALMARGRTLEGTPTDAQLLASPAATAVPPGSCPANGFRQNPAGPGLRLPNSNHDNSKICHSVCLYKGQSHEYGNYSREDVSAHADTRPLATPREGDKYRRQYPMTTVIPGKAMLSAQEVSKSFGAQQVLSNVSLTVHESDCIGLIGRNGCGKSTLLRILAGLMEPDGGFTTRAQGVRVALLDQHCTLSQGQTVADALKNATAGLRGLMEDWRVLMEQLAHVPPSDPAHALLDQQCHDLQHHIDMAHGWNLDTEIKKNQRRFKTAAAGTGTVFPVRRGTAPG